MKISIDNTKVALSNYMDNKIMPAISSENATTKWLLGGVSAIALSRLQNIIEVYKPILNALGVLDETGNLCLEVVEKFINSAFNKQEIVRMPILGVPFRFDKSDGDYLIECLRKVGE